MSQMSQSSGEKSSGEKFYDELVTEMCDDKYEIEADRIFEFAQENKGWILENRPEVEAAVQKMNDFEREKVKKAKAKEVRKRMKQMKRLQEKNRIFCYITKPSSPRCTNKMLKITSV